MTEYKLLFCEECYQMTNHKLISLGNYKCMKCKDTEKELSNTR